MTSDLVPSQALLEATRAERERLERMLATAREELNEARRRAEAIEAHIAEIVGQLKRLAELAGEELTDAVLADDDEPERVDGREVLRGARIRRAAVHVMLTTNPAENHIHYRDLHRLMFEAGYEIAGGDPAAVLLTQISRSPLIVRAPENGTYRLDPLAPQRLRDRLHALEQQRNALVHGRVQPGAELGEVAERLQRLKTEIARVERQLHEAIETVQGLDAADWFTGIREIAHDEGAPVVRVAAA